MSTLSDGEKYALAVFMSFTGKDSVADRTVWLAEWYGYDPVNHTVIASLHKGIPGYTALPNQDACASAHALGGWPALVALASELVGIQLR